MWLAHRQAGPASRVLLLPRARAGTGIEPLPMAIAGGTGHLPPRSGYAHARGGVPHSFLDLGVAAELEVEQHLIHGGEASASLQLRPQVAPGYARRWERVPWGLGRLEVVLGGGEGLGAAGIEQGVDGGASVRDEQGR
ncbi:hypothetical protein D1007_05458 [Hordeum vulgare]|nr:hypothetical protein D1007_05458 [Hordeum vulgare]